MWCWTSYIELPNRMPRWCVAYLITPTSSIASLFYLDVSLRPAPTSLWRNGGPKAGTGCTCIRSRNPRSLFFLRTAAGFLKDGSDVEPGSIPSDWVIFDANTPVCFPASSLRSAGKRCERCVLNRKRHEEGHTEIALHEGASWKPRNESPARSFRRGSEG